MDNVIKFASAGYTQAFNDGYNEGYAEGYNEGYAEGGDEASNEMDLLRLKMAQDSLDQLIQNGHWNEYFYLFRTALQIIAHDPAETDEQLIQAAIRMRSLARQALETQRV